MFKPVRRRTWFTVAAVLWLPITAMVVNDLFHAVEPQGPLWLRLAVAAPFATWLILTTPERKWPLRTPATLVSQCNCPRCGGPVDDPDRPDDGI